MGWHVTVKVALATPVALQVPPLVYEPLPVTGVVRPALEYSEKVVPLRTLMK